MERGLKLLPYHVSIIDSGDEELELHVNLAELLGCLFKTHGQDFLPAFEDLLLPCLLEMARPESLPEDRKVNVIPSYVYNLV